MSDFQGFITTGDEYAGDGHIYEVYSFDYGSTVRWRAQEMDGKDTERTVCGPTFFGGTYRELVSKCIDHYNREREEEMEQRDMEAMRQCYYPDAEEHWDNDPRGYE